MGNENKRYVSLGIDLGTTNSAITYCYTDKGSKITKVLNVPNSKSGILPSCVLYHSKDSYEVGLSAYENRWKPSVVYSMKRFMELGDNYKVDVIAENGDRFQESPIDVGAKVLKAMKDFAELSLGINGDDICAKYTITVPAYFNEIARFNTVEAGIRAGIPKENITLINEPTAAALSYGSGNVRRREKILVYDLGGGTFDVAMLEITNGAKGHEFVVSCCDGNDKLGGDDLDTAVGLFILDKAIEKLNEDLKNAGSDCKCEVNPNFNKECEAFKHIMHLGEGCKKSQTTTTVTVYFNEDILGDNYGIVKEILTENYMCKINIPFEEIENISQKVLVEPTVEIIENLFKQCRSVPKKMILIGGSTKGPELIEGLEEALPQLIISNTSDPDRSVAIGAGIYTEMCVNGDSDKLKDIIQLPIGVCSLEGNRRVVSPIIRQNSRIPASGFETFQVLSRDQEELTAYVYQGRSSNPDDCIYLGELRIDNLQEIIKKSNEELPKLQVALMVDLSGLLSAYVMIGEHTFHAKINRLAAGSKEKVSKESAIKSRQINTIKSLVPEEMVSKYLEEYEKEYAKGRKEASVFIKKIKDEFSDSDSRFRPTSLF